MLLVELKENLQYQLNKVKNKEKSFKKKYDRSLKIIVQEDKLKNVLNLGKHKGDMTGIGYETNVPKPNKTPRNGVGPKTTL